MKSVSIRYTNGVEVEKRNLDLELPKYFWDFLEKQTVGDNFVEESFEIALITQVLSYLREFDKLEKFHREEVDVVNFCMEKCLDFMDRK